MRTEIHDRDGVKYEIVATASNAGYVASWKCQACLAWGATSHEYSNEDEAIGTAKALLFSEHHSLTHFDQGPGADPGNGSTKLTHRYGSRSMRRRV